MNINICVYLFDILWPRQKIFIMNIPFYVMRKVPGFGLTAQNASTESTGMPHRAFDVLFLYHNKYFHSSVC